MTKVFNVRFVLFCILLLAVFLRVWYLYEIYRYAPDYSALQQDPEVQDYFARAILTGDWSVPEGVTDPEMRTTPFFRPPGHGYFLSFLYRFISDSYMTPRIINAIAGILTVLLSYYLGKAIFNEWVGVIFSFLVATYGVFVYWEGEVNDPALFVFFVVLIFYILYRWSIYKKWYWCILLGLVIGAYATMRPNILSFGPFIALWMVWITLKERKYFAFVPSWIALFIFTFIPIIPITLRNYVASGEWVLISTYFGENLFIGNNPEADGTTPWNQYLQKLEGTGNWTARDYVNVVKGLGKELGIKNLKHADASKIFAQMAIEYIKNHPKETAIQVLKKAILLWCPIEITCNKVVYYEIKHYPPLKYLPTFPWAGGLFITGTMLLIFNIKSGFKKKKLSQLFVYSDGTYSVELLLIIYLFIATYLGSFLMFFVNGRARVPVIPLFLLIGANVIYFLWLCLKNKNYLVLTRWLSVLFISFIFISVKWVPFEPDLARWHYQRADSYLRRGEIEKALEEAQTLIYMPRSLPYMHHRLGKDLYKAGYFKEAKEQFEKGIRLDPSYQDMFYYLGKTYLALKDDDKAEKYFRKSLELNPDDARSHNEIGEILERQGNWKEALAHYEKALKIVPDFTYVLDKYGRILSSQGRSEEALAFYKKALETDPSYQDVYYLIGRELRNLGRLEEARNTLVKAIELNPKDARALCELGNILADDGEWDTAGDYYQQAISAKPDFAYAYERLGRILFAKDNLNEAENSFKKAIELNPEYQDSIYLLGCVVKKQERLNEAETYFRKAVELNVRDARAWNELGEIMEIKKDYEQAVYCYEKALEAYPQFSYVIAKMGAIYANQGEYEKSLEKLKLALNVNPDFQNVCYMIGQVLSRMGNKEEAITYLEKAIKMNPNDARAHRELAILIQDDDPEKAIEHFKKALEIVPDFTLVLNNWGSLLVKLNKWDEAEKKFYEALKIRPNDELAYYNLAQLAEKRGNTEEAIELYQKGMVNSPDNSYIPYDLGVLYDRMGRMKEAEEMYNKALEIDDKNPLAYNNLGYHAFLAGDMDKAIEFYQKSLSIKPDLINALYNIAEAFYAKGELEKVISYFEKALEKQPKDHNLHNALGFYALQVNMYDLAEKHLKEAINLQYKFPLAWRNLGNLYKIQKRYDEAEKAYKTAIEIYPSDGEGWADYALFKKEAGHFEEALSLFQEALRRYKDKENISNESIVKALLEIADVYIMLNQKEKANEILEEVLKIQPDNEDVKRMLTKIDKVEKH
ncbi:MAG TPA: tetratricopeptide repeat protein [Candidatus Hydrogenedens sp.]|nr:tetratricopeptide repeat protein [Candidatus Hydrogenedens sp.]